MQQENTQFKICPFCAEKIQAEARVCKHCKRKIPFAELEKFVKTAEKKFGTPKTKIIASVVVLAIVVLGTTAFTNWFSNSGGSNQNSILDNTPTDRQAVIVGKSFVEKYLTYPSSSEFPDTNESKVTKSDKTYTIRHWVDASNAFGARKRTYYILQIRYNGGDWADISSWQEVSFLFD